MRVPLFAKLVMVVCALTLISACGERKTVKGPGATELTLTAPTNQTLERGEQKSVTIRIDRDEFEGPIALEISGLPAGVEAVGEKTIPTGTNTREITLAASDTATLIEDQVITVIATPSGSATNVPGPVRTTFRLTIKDRN